MQYAESPPVPALGPFLECVWTLEGHADALGGEPQAVLPDGRPELVLHFGDPFDRLDPCGSETRAVRQPLVLFAGQLKSQLLLQPQGRISVLGLRFRPSGAAAMLQLPQDQLAGTTQAMADLAPALARELETVRDTARDLQHAAELAQHALLAFLDHSRLDARIDRAVAEIERCYGQLSIDDLAAGCGMTRRHLERQFQRVVGMSPKRLARIVRFQRAIRSIEGTEEGTRHTGAVTAAVCGYADQAHFIRDFRDLAGCAPSEHLLNKGILTGFFTSKS